jgi:hypothetical protein
MDFDKMSNEEIMQSYSNACANLGNTQTLIFELDLRLESLRRDLNKLNEKRLNEVTIANSLRKEAERRQHESQNKQN